MMVDLSDDPLTPELALFCNPAIATNSNVAWRRKSLHVSTFMVPFRMPNWPRSLVRRNCWSTLAG
ncbi:MAG: hypothetical protein WB676_11555 [Bryobacteraceae bacterium]